MTDNLEEYSKELIKFVKNIMENSDETEEQYAFSKIYHKLNDIHICINVLKKEYKELNKKESNKKEFNIDDVDEYYKSQIEFINEIKKMHANDKDLMHFCDMVLDDIDIVQSSSHILKSKYNFTKNILHFE